MYRLLTDLAQPAFLLALLALLAFANLWRKRRESRRRLLLLAVPLLLLSICSTPLVCYLALGSLEWSYPPLEEPPDDVQAIVVLAGRLNLLDDAGTQVELGEDTLYRCLRAADLYRRGKPRPVLVSGGKVDPTSPGPSLAAAMREFLRGQGVADNDLIVEDVSRTTYENAVESGHLLAERGIRKIALVTDAAHLRRAVGCFRKQGLEVVPCGCRYRAAHLEWSAWTFLPNASAARGFQEAWHEWLGTVWYRLRAKM